MNKMYYYLICFMTLMTWVQPVHAQLAKRVDQGSAAYQGLVRQNLELRKELKELERKYVDLENERKVLILHVKDLQATREATDAVIEDLKTKIASLRLEMLKDPQMVKTLDELNRRIVRTEDERDELQRRVEVLNGEKSKLLNEIKVVRGLYNEQKETLAGQEAPPAGKPDDKRVERLTKELEAQRAKLQKAEEEYTELEAQFKEVKAQLKEKTDALAKAKTDRAVVTDTKEARKLQDELQEAEKRFSGELRQAKAKNDTLAGENERLLGELKEIKRLLAMAEADVQEKDTRIEAAKVPEDRTGYLEKRNKDLEQEIMKLRSSLTKTREELKEQSLALKKENERLETALREKDGQFRKEIRDLNKQSAQLEINLQRAENARDRFEKKLAETEEKWAKVGEENRALNKERKKWDDLAKEGTKELQKELDLAEDEQERFKQIAKDASADKLMLEARAAELETRAAQAEAKLAEAQQALDSQTATAALQGSELMELKEKKAVLEQKLIRYIDKVLESDTQRPKGMIAHDRDDAAFATEELPKRGLKILSKKEIRQQKLDMHYNLALAYDRRGMYQEERQEYLKCLRINPNDANVHYNLAILYDDKLNMNEKAIEHYQRYLELRPVGEDVQQVKTWMLHAEQEARMGRQMK